jgi:hypothetical protein
MNTWYPPIFAAKDFVSVNFSGAKGSRFSQEQGKIAALDIKSGHSGFVC